MKLYFRLLVIALFLQISPQNGARKVLLVVEKQSNRGKKTHQYTTMKLYSGQFKIQNTYSIFFTQCKRFNKEF